MAGRGISRAQTGSITVIQRFGSAVRLNLHFHILVLAGGYTESADGAVRFHAGRAPSTADVEALVVRIAARAEQWLDEQGYGPDDEPDRDIDDGQELVQEASLLGRIGLGRRAGQRARRVVRLGGREVSLPPRCAVCAGYNLHANVAVGRRARDGLERLARYICRPALAKSRLERRRDGQIVLHMKRVWSDGTAAMVFSPAELVARLAALVPPPNKNQVLYHGVLAPNAALRSRVVPKPTAEPEAERCSLVRPDRRARGRRRWRTWSSLLLRVFGVEAWLCPHCDEPMVLRTVVIGPPATLEIIRGLGQSARGSPSGSVAASRA